MNPDSPIWALIPASGIGQRMHSETPKQYLVFQGKTILEHCLDRLLSHPRIEAAVIVLNEHDEYWEKLSYSSPKPIYTTLGGEQRHDSVYRGLLALQHRAVTDALILVHDAVRPLVTHLDLDKVIAAALGHEVGAILAAPVSDTLKLQSEIMEIISTVSRERLWRALTPQAFHQQPLLRALKSAIDKNLEISDDASALELLGYRPALVAGDADNIKITMPADLRLAELIWLNQRDQQDDK